MMVVLIMQERFTRKGPWSAPIATILFIVGKEIRFGRSSLLPFMALLFFLWERWLPPQEWLLLVWVVCILSSRSLLYSRSRKWSWH